jgi:ADP-ribosylation factor-like protein 3
LIGEEALNKVPLLVFANKQDLQFALEAEEVVEKLQLADISDRTWNIQACSALTKEGKSPIKTSKSNRMLNRSSRRNGVASQDHRAVQEVKI